MKTDAVRVRRLREQRAWSQEQLAEIAGINVRTLQRVEASGGGSLETRMALAAALEVSPVDLCTPSASASSPVTGDAHPDPPGFDPQHPVFRGILRVLVAILFALLLIFGYMFGRDLAQRHNRADAQAAAEQGTETPAPASTRQPHDSGATVAPSFRTQPVD